MSDRKPCLNLSKRQKSRRLFKVFANTLENLIIENGKEFRSYKNVHEKVSYIPSSSCDTSIRDISNNDYDDIKVSSAESCSSSNTQIFDNFRDASDSDSIISD